jgi:hypothetical protein
LQPTALGFLDGLPEQEVGAAELVEPRIGAAVLEDKGTLEAQGKDAGDGPTVFLRHMNREAVAEPVDQVTEPHDWLGR